MNGATVDRQIRFVVQVGKTVMDSDVMNAKEVETALRDYGFKDAQVLGKFEGGIIEELGEDS